MKSENRKKPLTDEDCHKMYLFAKGVQGMLNSPANEAFFEKLRQQKPNEQEEETLP